MSGSVTVQIVHPRKLAAVRRLVRPREVALVWRPAVDQVWDFIHTQPGLWSGGHNVFVYHQPDNPGADLRCDFGVEVTRSFETSGEVFPTETPGGEAVVAVHRGSYDRLSEAYGAIEGWQVASGRQAAGITWEIYGDPTSNPADTETTVVRLLK